MCSLAKSLHRAVQLTSRTALPCKSEMIIEQFSFPLPPFPGSHSSVLFFYEFDCCRSSCKWVHAAFVFLGLAYFTSHNVFKVLPCCSIWHDFLILSSWIIFSCVYIPHLLYPFIYGWTFRLLPHLGCVNSSAMNMGVQMSLWDSAFNFCGYVLRSDIARLYGSYILNFLRNCSTVCHSNYTVLEFYQQCARVPISTYPHQNCYFLFWVFFFFFESFILIFMRWCHCGLFAFPWWYMMLSIFSYVCWPFVYILWINVYSSPWPIFLNWGFGCF